MAIYEIHPSSSDISPEYSKFIYFVENWHTVNRMNLLGWFTIHEKVLKIDDVDDKVIGKSVLVTDDISLTHIKTPIVHLRSKSKIGIYGIHQEHTDDGLVLLYYIGSDPKVAPFSMYDKFILKAGMIENYATGPDILTDIGKFFLNGILMVKPFGDKIPYINERINPSSLDSKVAKLITSGEVGRKEYNAYMDWGYWYGNDGTIATPIWTKKALTTDPKIKARKKELFDKYRDQLHDPVVMTNIEDELIQMDKDWVKDDPVSNYFEAAGGGTYKEIRKKMFITVGLAVAFDKNTGNYDVVESSLSDGWKPESMPVLANDIRRGSYGRSMKTAEGGAESKGTGRIYQGVSITEDDCKSTGGIVVSLTENNVSNFLRRVLVDGTIINDKNMKSFIGKTVTIRSPMYCKTANGYCNYCCGLTFKDVSITEIGPNVLSVTSDFLLVAMKSMHKSSVSSRYIEDISRFFR